VPSHRRPPDEKGDGMKRIVLVAAILTVSSGVLRADPWTKSVDANLTMTQSAYTDNWAGGAVGSLTWVFSSNSLFERQINPTMNTRNTLKLFFGQTHSQDEATKEWSRPFKSTDRIDFESIFKLTLGRFVDPYASVRIESQFLDQRDPANERYVNPALFTESFGVAKVFAKSGRLEWTARLGGAFRQALDRDILDPLSGARSTETATDGGIIFVSDFVSPIGDTTTTVTSRLQVYEAFFNSKSDELAGEYNMDYWKAPDIAWEIIFKANINRYLMVNLYARFLYDKEVDLAGRFEETLSFGFTYKIM
jgi:hypothetical protein